MSSALCPNSNDSLIHLYNGALTHNNDLVNYTVSCNCSSWNLDTVDSKPISVLRIITSLCSIIGSASIILTVLLTGKLNAAEVHPLFILSVSDFILSILWMIGGIVWLSPGQHGWVNEGSSPHTGMCYVLAVATTMATIVTFCLTAVYALSAMLRMREFYLNQGKQLPKQDKRKTLRHVTTVAVYIISWIIPLIIVLPAIETTVGIDRTNKGCWCILDFFNLRPDDGKLLNVSSFHGFALSQATILSVSFLLTTFLILVCYSVTFCFVRGVLKQQNSLQEQNRGSRTIRTIVIRLSLFLLIFFVCGLPTFMASIIVWVERDRLHLDEPPDRAILYLHAIFSPLQGFLNAIVYGWSRREFRRAVTTRERMRFSRSQEASPGSRYQSLNRNSMGGGRGTFMRVNTGAMPSSPT